MPNAVAKHDQILKLSAPTSRYPAETYTFVTTRQHRVSKFSQESLLSAVIQWEILINIAFNKIFDF
jgi:hypothetical protein